MFYSRCTYRFFDIVWRSEKIRYEPVPSELQPLMQEKRHELVAALADADEAMAELFLNEVQPSDEQIQAAVRRATTSLQFCPVFMGSAFKNKSVQPLLDGVIGYLPNPLEAKSYGLDRDNQEAPVLLTAMPKDPFVGLAFKLEESKFGQLTYMKVYQGTLKRGQFIYNAQTDKKLKVPRLVRMHANQMQEVDEIRGGEIGAMFGVECNTGETFTDGRARLTMTSMFVPQPVLSLSIAPKSKDSNTNFSKALNRFQREDPTFRVSFDAESGQTLISGMGELHLEIYAERIKREYGCECTTGRPQVAFREAIQGRSSFDYLHKKQTGGAGQYARVAGYIEVNSEGDGMQNEFVNEIVGNAIPNNYVAAVQKGFEEAAAKGSLVGHPVVGVRFVLNDGASHAVDSSDMAFKIAAVSAFRKAYEQASAMVLEPIMSVEVQTPVEFQGAVMGSVNRRKGLITRSETREDFFTLSAEVPLNEMFGYSTELRSLTQGKGEFTMEYLKHAQSSAQVQAELVAEYKKKRAAGITE